MPPANVCTHPNQRHRLGMLLLDLNTVVIQLGLSWLVFAAAAAAALGGRRRRGIVWGCRLCAARHRKAQHLQQGCFVGPRSCMALLGGVAGWLPCHPDAWRPADTPPPSRGAAHPPTSSTSIWGSSARAVVLSTDCSTCLQYSATSCRSAGRGGWVYARWQQAAAGRRRAAGVQGAQSEWRPAHGRTLVTLPTD